MMRNFNEYKCMSDNKNPEQKARDTIDRKLNASGWVVQEKNGIDWGASDGIAVKEYLTDVGPGSISLPGRSSGQWWSACVLSP